MHLKHCIYIIVIAALLQDISAKPVNFTEYPTFNVINDTFRGRDPYDSLRLGSLGLSRTGFDYAMIGYNKLLQAGLLEKKDILSIIDFTLTSDKKRLFVIDIKNYKVLFVTYAAHGRNSGKEKAIYFSNEPESFKSSVGFYLTGGTYHGSHGYSLRLQGYEKGYNDKAFERDIVVHSAEYVSDVIAKQQGYIGRSLGCPAVSPAVNKAVINAIKDKSCLFVFGHAGNYTSDSKLLERPVKKRNRFLPQQ